MRNFGDYLTVGQAVVSHNHELTETVVSADVVAVFRFKQRVAALIEITVHIVDAAAKLRIKWALIFARIAELEHIFSNRQHKGSRRQHLIVGFRLLGNELAELVVSAFDVLIAQA